MTNISFKLPAGLALATAVAGVAPIMAAADNHAPELSSTTVLTGLQDPWDMAFLPDGTMFFTEKCEGLSVMMPGGDVNPLVGVGGAEGYPANQEDLFCEGQAGMNGVAIDPNFAQNRQIYVYSASDMTAPGTNRVMKLTVNEGFTEASGRTDIVTDIPYKPEATDQPFGGPGAHNGGRLRFGPEGEYLYVTTGDNHNAEVPQSPTMLGGKVLRIATDGEAAEGNNPPEGFDPRIFTYGHRNVQGLTFHPETGQPITAEHGPWHSDEITALEAGANAGWDPRPNTAGRSDCPDGYCGYEPQQMEGMDPEERRQYMPMTDLETYPDAMPPAWDNNALSQGMTSVEFLTGDQWGAWEGHLVAGFMGIGFGGTPVGQRIDVIDIADDGLSVNDVTEMSLPMEAGRFRSLVQAPDGSLYAAIDEGTIYRITPE